MIKRSIIYLAIIIISFSACKAELEELEDYNQKSYTLLNQDSVQVNFPDIVKGKVTVLGYIYTNCIDICPLTTNNMRLLKEELEKEGIENIEYVSISFDPEFDTPSVLKSYAKVRQLDLSNWTFLTGKKSTIDSVMQTVNMVVIKSDSSTYQNGNTIFHFAHTDRIQLMDQNGILRRNYIGSKLRMDEIINDVKTLIGE